MSIVVAFTWRNCGHGESGMADGARKKDNQAWKAWKNRGFDK
jgi:hypothetical protein